MRNHLKHLVLTESPLLRPYLEICLHSEVLRVTVHVNLTYEFERAIMQSLTGSVALSQPKHTEREHSEQTAFMWGR